MKEGGARLKISIIRLDVGRKLISIGASFVIVAEKLSYFSIYGRMLVLNRNYLLDTNTYYHCNLISDTTPRPITLSGFIT